MERPPVHPRSATGRFSAVVNAGAGTVLAAGPDAIAAMLREALGPRLAGLRIVAGPLLAEACREALAEAPDALLILGGDGTIRTAAAAVAGTNSAVPLVLLPGGTMNVLPKRVWGPAELGDVLALLAEGRVAMQAIDCGDANGRPFFVAAAFGAFSTLTAAREDVRSAPSVAGTLRAVWRVLTLGHRLWRPAVRWRADGTEARAAALIVTLGDADRLAPWRDPPSDPPAFEVVAFRVRSWFEAVRIAIVAAFDPHWRDDGRIESHVAATVDVTSGRAVRCTLDGERVVLRGPVAIRYRPGGLRCIGPIVNAAPPDETGSGAGPGKHDDDRPSDRLALSA